MIGVWWISTLPGLVREGRYLEPGGGAEIVIGAVLARNLRIGVDEELTFIGSGFDDSFAAGIVTVVGIFDSGIADLDRSLAQVNQAYFDETFGMRGHAHTIVLRAARVEDAESLQARIEAGVATSDKIEVRHWDQLQPGLRQSIQADLASNSFMYFILVVLVAFSVLNTQLMSVLERTREFGVMLALGLQPSRLARLVMLETALMTAVGMLLGIGAGFLLVWYLGQVGFSYPGMEEMASRFNLPDRLYPEISLFTLTFGPLIVALASLLAAVYPALRLYLLQPIEAMRAV